MNKLGFGLMRLPLRNSDDTTSIDLDTMKDMVDHFIAAGCTYFDTAYPYHNGYSETAFRETVAKRYPRTAFTVTDKMPTWLINNPADFQNIFNEQLQRCGVDYFDYYWLHALNHESYEQMQRMDGFGFIQRMQREGRIRHIGFSFHDEAPLLERILTEHPEAEYVQLQINYLDWDSPSIQAHRCYDIATAHGKPVIVMEPLKGGSLAQVPDSVDKDFHALRPSDSAASWALRFVASLPNVMMILSGMGDPAQMDDNLHTINSFTPLSEKEQILIHKAADYINSQIAIPCTACHYCTEGCPQHIAIPEYFSLYNTFHQFGDAQRMNTSVYYDNLTASHGAASSCIECGQCEAHCPQHLPIIENLKLVKGVFENG